MFKKQDPYRIIGIPLILLFVLFTLILLEGMASLRIKELKINLQRIGENEISKNNLSLLSKYKQIRDNSRKVIQQRANNDNSALFEAELMGLLASTGGEKIKSEGLMYYFETPVLFFVNTLGYLFGSKGIQDSESDEKRGLLTLASFYERKRNYLNAVKVFSTAIEQFEEDSNKIAFSFLHRGFCFMMLGEHKKAKEDFRAALLLKPNHEEGIIAELFLMQLDKTLKRVDSLARKKDSVKKGLDYYSIMTYTKAIQTFDKMEKGKKINKKLYFYRGRAYEEIGFRKNAVQNYQKVLKKYPNSKFARKAYRRLYILGVYYEGNQKIKEMAAKRLVALGDGAFVQKSQNIEDVVETKLITAIPQTKAVEKAIHTVEEKTGTQIKKDTSPPVKKPEKEPRDNSPPEDSDAPEEEDFTDDDFLASLFSTSDEPEKDIAFIQKDLQKLDNVIKESKKILKKAEKEAKDLEKEKQRTIQEQEKLDREKEEKERVERAKRLQEKLEKEEKEKQKLLVEQEERERQRIEAEQQYKPATKVEEEKNVPSTEIIKEGIDSEGVGTPIEETPQAKPKPPKRKRPKKRTDKEILFDDKTKPKTRKRLIKKLYPKVFKILTKKGTFVGYIFKEDETGVYVITAQGTVIIRPDEKIYMRLPGSSEIMMK